MKKKFSLPKIEHWHKIAALMIIYDIIAVNLSYLMALWFRFDCSWSAISADFLERYFRFIPISTVLCVGVFLVMRLYNSIWRFASYVELIRSVGATAINTVAHLAIMSLVFGRMPVTYYIFGFAFHFIMTVGIRFSYRLRQLMRKRFRPEYVYSSFRQVMLIGAGAAGQMILRDINSSHDNNLRICCIIDDNSNKWGRYIDGVPVVGGRDEILSAAKKYAVEQILVAVPSASREDKRDILNICKETGCKLKSLPGMSQVVTGQVSVGDMKDVAVEDLLGRDQVETDLSQVFRFIRGKTVLVTGGGGSIGSELCRQIAGHDPALLIIFDVYENNAYDIQQELREKHPQLNLKVLIGSVRDSRRLNELFAAYKPQLVYHAAAHKHVPLMEDSPCEAIKNNVIGTYKTAYAAMAYGCERFVLISTDKAVNPTNVMGASKRLCEMVVQSFDRAVKEGKAASLPPLYTHKGQAEVLPGMYNSRTEFVAVRFGNVLGSNGSVIPLFKKQIAAGGPVRVTHPDIIRYFMTIPEAVSLVLQAGTYANGGEIFVLDMGVPVKIDQLARNLIKLSGYEPDVDIPVVYTGLRPGEKLYEEKLMAEEGLQKTDNALIHIGNPIPFDTDAFLEDLQELMDAAYRNDPEIIKLVSRVVPTYRQEALKDKTYQALYKEAIHA